MIKAQGHQRLMDSLPEFLLSVHFLVPADLLLSFSSENRCLNNHVYYFVRKAFQIICLIIFLESERKAFIVFYFFRL